MRVPLHRLLLALAAISCSLSEPDENPVDRLAEARLRWQASGVVDYQIAMRRSCGECLPAAASAVVVSVSDGRIVVSLAANGEPIDPAYIGLYPDVDGLFDLIEDALLGGVADVQVTYDRDRGYPRSVSIDALPDAVDDEFGYVVEGLVIGRHADLRAELRAQRQKWAAEGIHDYQLTLSRGCFCPPEGAGLVVLTVLDGEPVEWLYFLSGDPLEPQWRAAFPTVDGLFEIIEDAIDRGADRIEVSYDDEVGLPMEIRVDYRLGMADEEIAYRVEKILRIDPGGEPDPGRGTR